jgi:hypothetical protein
VLHLANRTSGPFARDHQSAWYVYTHLRKVQQLEIEFAGRKYLACGSIVTTIKNFTSVLQIW